MPGEAVPLRHGDLAAALERLPLPVYVLGADGTVRWLNSAGRALFGDRVGEHFTSVIAPESRRLARDEFARKMLGDAAASDYEAVLVRADGARVPVEVSSARLEADGRLVGAFGVLVPEQGVAPAQLRELTPRQSEVLGYLARGCSTRQIADELGVSIDTVRNHVRDLLKRLDVHSRLEAVLVARERGLL